MHFLRQKSLPLQHGFSPKKSLVLALLALSSSAAMAVDYNDAYWSNPTTNSDFVDHFNSGSINRTNWSVETNIYVNGEDQDYQDVEYPAADWTVRSGQDDAGALDGKVLNLKARYMDGQIQANYGGNGKPLFIRAGRIESQITDESTFVYGKFEARIKMPPARNAEFPAWWLLGNFPDVGWTACQELDIIEFTGNNPTKAPQTHWSAPYAAYGGNPNGTTYAQLGVDPSNEYVTYGVVKTPEYVDFYVNGVKTYSWTKAERGDMPWPYLTPMRMILNHAITHVEWPDVGNYNKFSTDANVANKTGYTRVTGGVTEYEYIDTASMDTNIGRAGTDFLVDYVAHWPLPSADPLQKYVDETKNSFFRATNNTKGFYSLKGWMAPVSVTADAYLQEGDNAVRDNGAKNAADGYVGSKWATPRDDNMHSVTIDYGMDKPIKYFWIEWSWNLPKSYDIYGKTSSGNWEYVLTSNQQAVGWATHTFDVNKTYRYIKLVTKGRIDKAEPIWLLEFKAFEDVANVYPKPAGTSLVDRSVNVLGNGDFTTNLNGWNGENYDGSGAAYTLVDGEARITAATQGANAGSYQLHTQGFGLKRNYRYQVSFRARAAAERDIKVRLSEDQLNPSAPGTYLLETITLGTTMADYSFYVDYTDGDNGGRLAFLFGGMGNETTYIDDVVISEVAYIGSGDLLVPAISTTNFSGASSGWETEWWGVATRAVDSSTGNKASGVPGIADDQDLWVSVNIDPNYEVKEVLVAGDKSSPRSLTQFKVEYGIANDTMIDWTNSNTDGVYESFSSFSAYPPANERNFRIWFRPPAGQVVEVADVQLMAVDLKPHRIYIINLDGVGSITPANTLRYSKNNTDSATYTFTPPAGQQVANVIVDDVSLGAMDSYTFNAISASHTIAVSFTGSASLPSSASSSNEPSSTPSSTSSSSVLSSVPSSVSSSSVAASVPSSLSSSSVPSSVPSSLSSSSISSSVPSSLSSSSVLSSAPSSLSSSSVSSSVPSGVSSSSAPSSVPSSVSSSSAPDTGGSNTPDSSSSTAASTASSTATSTDSSSADSSVATSATSSTDSSTTSSTVANTSSSTASSTASSTFANTSSSTASSKKSGGGGSINWTILLLLAGLGLSAKTTRQKVV